MELGKYFSIVLQQGKVKFKVIMQKWLYTRGGTLLFLLSLRNEEHVLNRYIKQ